MTGVLIPILFPFNDEDKKNEFSAWLINGYLSELRAARKLHEKHREEEKISTRSTYSDLSIEFMDHSIAYLSELLREVEHQIGNPGSPDPILDDVDVTDNSCATVPQKNSL